MQFLTICERIYVKDLMREKKYEKSIYRWK